MRKLLILILIVAALGAAFWFLPWWLSLILLVVVALPLAWVGWKILSVLREVTNAIAEVTPKKHLCSLAAAEPFRGNYFAFTFPVACEVSQMTSVDLEALVLKPQVHPHGENGDSMFFVSTILKDEMKATANEKFEELRAQAHELKVDEFVPIEVGTLQGERRTFQATKDDKQVRGEIVCLGSDSHSVVWVVITPSEEFESMTSKYRELATMIQRVNNPTSSNKPSDATMS